ncbi:hypothetical protein [Paenibacillus kyungheensis]
MVKKTKIINRKIVNLFTFSFLATSLFLSSASFAFADAKKLYEYDANGRLISTTTTKEKTAFIYDANGNLLSKQVTNGDYSSVINPSAPVTPTPAPTPAPTPVPTPTPVPAPPDPTLVPPAVPVPAKSGLPINYVLDVVEYKQDTHVVNTYGWYLDPAGIAKVDLYIDDVNVGRGVMGGSREDVYKVYPDYNNHVAGFYQNGLTFSTAGTPHKKRDRKTDKKKVVPGEFDHVLRIVITNKQGKQTVIESIFVVDLNS